MEDTPKVWDSEIDQMNISDDAKIILNHAKWVKQDTEWKPHLEQWFRSVMEMEALIKHQAKQIEDLKQVIIDAFVDQIDVNKKEKYIHTTAKILVRPVAY
jgi:hypothetical protein